MDPQHQLLPGADASFPRAPIIIAVVVGLVVVLAAVVVVMWMMGSRKSESPTTEPAVSVSTPPADGGIFSSPEAIVQKAGMTLPCGDADNNEDVIGAISQVRCGGGNVVIRVYDGIQGVNDAISLMRLVGGNLLTGQNWTVNADLAILKAAQPHLGGIVVEVPCEKPDCVLAD